VPGIRGSFDLSDILSIAEFYDFEHANYVECPGVDTPVDPVVFRRGSRADARGTWGPTSRGNRDEAVKFRRVRELIDQAYRTYDRKLAGMDNALLLIHRSTQPLGSKLETFYVIPGGGLRICIWADYKLPVLHSRSFLRSDV
jgi:hypothetical protein